MSHTAFRPRNGTPFLRSLDRLSAAKLVKKIKRDLTRILSESIRSTATADEILKSLSALTKDAAKVHIEVISDPNDPSKIVCKWTYPVVSHVYTVTDPNPAPPVGVVNLDDCSQEDALSNGEAEQQQGSSVC
jgi:hypothetical protein